MTMARYTLLLFLLILAGCREQSKNEAIVEVEKQQATIISHARGLRIWQEREGFTVIEVTEPWPGAKESFRYALVDRELLPRITLARDAYDAIIPTPVERIILTSTTHIPALEILGETERLVGFPQTDLISSPETRKRVDLGAILEVGSNEALNLEQVIALKPDLVVGFSIASSNKTYENLKRSGIPVVYNGDWTEHNPLGKAEWIKFLAPFFNKEEVANNYFEVLEENYMEVKSIAAMAEDRPAVLCGALWKDIWYLPGGNSWMATFLEDANSDYLWSETNESGSLSLSLEAVIEKGSEADFWISPSQYTSYEQMEEANRHYPEFKPFQERMVFTFARSKGSTGGYLYYELAPLRPDLVLKDLVHHLHPSLLPDHEPYFFKPLE